MAAIRLSDELDAQQRPAEPHEQEVLARWTGWGAVPEAFDETNTGWAEARQELRDLLGEQAYAQARRTILNAHYTDPRYVDAIWSGLERLGFAGGRVLEPGSGLGTFIGRAPEAAEMIGVELDPTTARISRRLHPHAEIRNESFADTRLAGGVDAVVGNVPFGDFAIHDRTHNPDGKLSIHNHFIVKALANTRPGGTVAVLTSSWTLDAKNPHARRTMAASADLLGALRLPVGAHKETAGTDVQTDLLVFRRRHDDEPAADDGWTRVVEHDVDGETFTINSHFVDHPERMLGTLTARSGRFGPEAVVQPADPGTTAGDIATAISAGLDRVAAAALAAGRAHDPQPMPSAAPIVVDAGDLPAWDGAVVHDEGAFLQRQGNDLVPFAVPKSAAVEFAQLLRMRDDAHRLLAMQAATDEETDESVELREQLAAAYAGYTARYGAVNRAKLIETKRLDAETGEPVVSRRTPTATRLLRRDPSSAIVFALEIYDDETQTATPARILTDRVIAPRPAILGADTPQEAVAISLERHGEINVDTVADLLGIDTVAARAQLTEVAYEDPAAPGKFVSAAAYLSGDVRAKLEEAEAAAGEQPRFAANVAALREVIPADLQPEDLAPSFGAAWIPASDVEEFLREITGEQFAEVTNPLPGQWNVSGGRRTVKSRVTWGTERRPAGVLLESMLRQTPIKVVDRDPVDGTTTFNAAETAEANEKARELRERFAEWVWEDPERTKRLVADYNRRFNAIVLRDYSREGEQLTFPGLIEGFTPRPHQRAAVARMIAEPTAGLFHEVGAGKTAEMVIGLTELRRLGLVNKPAAVVPNHMLEQFSREWLSLYPRARVLAASTDDLRGDARREFVARAATSDWDAVILTQGAFERLALGEEARRAYSDHALEKMRAELVAAAGRGDRRSAKQIESSITAEEGRMERGKFVAVDPGLRFEDTGIDYLAVDELHMYKNLHTASSISEANIRGSKRALDLEAKLFYLRSKHGPRVITGATATPLANSITEAHVMLRYLRPDLLQAAGVDEFDAWAATFGQMVTEIEVDPGGSFRAKSRLARFQNVPEMLRMFRVPGDVKTARDLDLPLPAIRPNSEGAEAAEIISIPASYGMLEYVDELQQRIDDVRRGAVAPTDDNMLKISSDGRAAALDLRLVDREPAEDGGKIAAAAATIHRIWVENRDNEYVDPATGEVSEVRGALQLAFLDLSTPTGDKPWNAYDELKTQLVALGMPAESIEFMQHHKKDSDKARLFARARNGHVALLIGSTANMGVGTNVQNRAIALHDIDCPWRPADLHQRQGRVLRQGNQNPEVQLYRYVSSRSFDGFMYQAVERKAKMIDQVMRGSLDIREMDDISEAALEAGQAKAIISGNPLLLERATLEREVQQLESLQRAHHRRNDRLTLMLNSERGAVARHSREVAELADVVDDVVSLDGDAFSMTVLGRTCTSRAEAADALREWAADNLRYLSVASDRDYGTVGRVGKFVLTARSEPHRAATPVVVLELAGVPRSQVMWKKEDFGAPGIGIITRLENMQARIPALLADATRDLQRADQALHDLQRDQGQPFKHTAALTDARARLADVTERLMQETQPGEPAAAERLNAGEPAPTASETAARELEHAERAEHHARLEHHANWRTDPAADRKLDQATARVTATANDYDTTIAKEAHRWETQPTASPGEQAPSRAQTPAAGPQPASAPVSTNQAADEFTRALTEGLADPDDDSALAAVIGSTERMRKATFRILTDRIAAGGLDRAQARKLAEQAPDVADALAPAIPLRGKLGVALGTIDAWAHMVGRSRFADPEILAAEAEELWTATETHFAQRLSDRQPPADFGPHPGPDNPERTGIPGITG